MRRHSLASLSVSVLSFVAALTPLACSSSSSNGPAPPTTVEGGDASEPGEDAGEPAAQPITAPAATWTWVPFEDASCANGSATGLGVNFGTSERVVIFLEGGGACWDEGNCYEQPTAVNVAGGYDGAKFAADFAPTKPTTNTVFDREAATNPFKDDSFVYVPYCTGDVHAGDKEQSYGGKVTKHVGRRNIQAFLKRLVPTFQRSNRVVLMGLSAGGFGAAWNYWRVAKAFDPVRVDLVDDSGPPFDQKYIGFYSTWSEAWDLPSALPPECAECKTNVKAVMPYYFATYPKSRFAFLSYTSDNIIRLFFGISVSRFQTALGELTRDAFDPAANARYFLVDATAHTMLRNLSVTTAGTTLASWLTEMQSDAPAWQNKQP